jgi:hypothetical protein
MPSRKELTGQRFGMLIVLQEAGKKNGRYVWECKCDCGNIAKVTVSQLINGHTQSCGCLRKDGKRKSGYSHGLSHTQLFRVWLNMKTRCFNPNAPNYKYYGGKGVSIFDEWRHNFQTFYDWAMTNGYTEGLVIDRIDSDGDYCPGNCRWITQSENARLANNKRWSHTVPAGIRVTACEK